MQCPLCTGVGRYAGKTRIENLSRHIKATHPERSILFRCWRCGFTPPEGTTRYPRKVVTLHCATCVPDILSEPAGREGALRRANIRRQLRGTDAVAEPPPPATHRRNTRRGQPSPEPAGTPAPEEARPGTPPLAREAEGPTVATPAIGSPPATPPHVVDNPATDPPADDTPSPSATETRAPEVARPEPPRTTT